jgi:UDP-N-acetylmuramyl pentapeptide synthase
VLSRDDAHFDLLRRAAPCRVITTSIGGDADYSARVIESAHARFNVRERATGEQEEIEVPLPGEHVVRNALFAVAVGRAHGVPWDGVRAALRKYVPLPMRWNRMTLRGVEIIDDAYNANPMSVRAALEAFAASPVKGRRWLVLGGMLELGRRTETEHRELGAEIAGGPWGGLVAVGPLGALVADGAGAAGLPRERIFRCTDAAEAAEVLRKHVVKDDAVLIKASRAEKLERVLEEWKRM